MTHRLLLIDDDDRLADMLATYLRGAGMKVDVRGDGASGLHASQGDVYDAVLLDVMLPDMDGFEVLRRLRARSPIPVLMLTARGDEVDRIVGLESGADDYLPKPFNPRELLARLRAVLRRLSPAPEAIVRRFGRLEIDEGAREVRVDGETRLLTSHQFEILRILAEHPGRTLTREALMEKVKGESLEAFDRSIDVHMSRIRAAIEDDPKAPRRILTIRGVGYLFVRSQDGEEGSGSSSRGR